MNIKYLEGYVVRTTIGCGGGKRFAYMEVGDSFDIVVFLCTTNDGVGQFTKTSEFRNFPLTDHGKPSLILSLP